MSSFVRFNTDRGAVNVNWTGPWPPPERLWTSPAKDGSLEVWDAPQARATEYVQASASILTDEDLAQSRVLQRGALYEPVP